MAIRTGHTNHTDALRHKRNSPDRFARIEVRFNKRRMGYWKHANNCPKIKRGQEWLARIRKAQPDAYYHNPEYNRITNEVADLYNAQEEAACPECPGHQIVVEAWIVVEFEGRVMGTRERNYSDDSDFYAVCWNGERLVEVEYATTRFPSTGSAQVDATEATKAEAEAYLRGELAALYRELQERNANKPDVGSEVEIVQPVTRGKNATPQGARGVVGWIGFANGGRRYRRDGTLRVRVDLDEPTTAGAERVFLDYHRVAVVNPQIDHDAREESLWINARCRDWTILSRVASARGGLAVF